MEKSYNTEKVGLIAKEILKDDGVSITFQNGMGNVEVLQVRTPSCFHLLEHSGGEESDAGKFDT